MEYYEQKRFIFLEAGIPQHSMCCVGTHEKLEENDERNLGVLQRHCDM